MMMNAPAAPAPAANEVETLRGFLSVAMAEEKYEKARQYMYLIEYITGEFSDDNMMMA
jgi:hypothetical protein